MEVSYYFKNLPPTDAIKAYTSKKIEKLKERLHHIEGIDVRFSLERQNQFFEITVHGDATVFHLKKSDKDLYAAIDNALDVLNTRSINTARKLERKPPRAKKCLLLLTRDGWQKTKTKCRCATPELNPWTTEKM